MISIIIIVGVWQGLTRSNKQGQGPVGVGSGRKVLTRVGKCWHGPAWVSTSWQERFIQKILNIIRLS